MIRNLKSLGLALVAVFALSAIAASSASAVDVFTVEGGGSTTISGTATNGVVEITSPELSAECTTVKLHGEVEHGASEGTGDASFEGTVGESHAGHCGSSIGAFDIDVNGCEIVITGETTGEDPVNEKDATVWIECPDEEEITMATDIVTLHVHEQTPTAGGLTYTNLPGGTVEAQATVTGITYSCTPHFFCTLGGIPTEANNADLTGSVVMEGAEGRDIEYSEQ